MSETLGPSPKEMGIKPSAIEQDAPKTEAKAQENQENFQAMNQLFTADRDGKNISELLASNPELAKSVERILKNPEYNPDNLTMAQIQGQSARESTPGETGTDNKWKNMVKLADGRSVANPFAVAAGLGRKAEQGGQNAEPGVKPEAKPAGETGEPNGADDTADKARAEAEKAKADRTARAQDDGEKAQVVIDKILTDWMKEGDENAPVNLSEGGKQEGFKRAKQTITETGPSSTSSYQADLPGRDVGKLARAIEASNASGAEDLKPVEGETKRSFADRIRDRVKSIFGQGEASSPAQTETSTGITAEQQNLSAKMAEEGFFAESANMYEGGTAGVLRPTTRRETGVDMQGSASTSVETPTGDRAAIKAFGEATRAADQREAAEGTQAADETKKAA